MFLKHSNGKTRVFFLNKIEQVLRENKYLFSDI